MLYVQYIYELEWLHKASKDIAAELADVQAILQVSRARYTYTYIYIYIYIYIFIYIYLYIFIYIYTL